jgi:hypothetical protein
MPSPFPTRGVVTAASLSALYSDPDVFPKLRGREFVAEKGATFSTRIKTASNSREVRVSDYPYPIWNFSITHSYARDLVSEPEVQKLFGFFQWPFRAALDSFFYYDEAEARGKLITSSERVTAQKRTFPILRPVGLRYGLRNVGACSGLLE